MAKFYQVTREEAQEAFNAGERVYWRSSEEDDPIPISRQKRNQSFTSAIAYIRKYWLSKGDKQRFSYFLRK